MQQESRLKKSLLNARVSLIFYFLTLALSFFSRKVFLDCLGAEFMGLTGTIGNLLSFLNLAELGIGGAIGYVLYKPIFEKDQQRINEIISVMGYLYRWVGLAILAAGCILACFLPLIYPNTGFDLLLIYFAFFSFLTSSLIGYFINYRQSLLGADQKNYVVTAYFQTGNILKTIIQMSLAYYTGNYYLWVAIEFIFGIIYSFILNWKINQTYPWLKAEVRQGRQLFKKYPEVMRYTRQLFIQKINGLIQFQTTPFLTYAFVSLQTVALYGNYNMLIDKVVKITIVVLSSIWASVGNLIAEGNDSRSEEVFWEIGSARFFIAGGLFVCGLQLLEPFIAFWLGSEYLLSKSILVLLLVQTWIQMITDNTSSFLYGYGLFADVWASFAQSFIFLTCALIGGYFWGMEGIIAAAITSVGIIQGLWKPYYLYSRGFKKSVMVFWRKWFYMFLLSAACCLTAHYFASFIYAYNYSEGTFISFILYGLFVAFVYLAIAALLFYSLNKSFRNLIQRLWRQKVFS